MSADDRQRWNARYASGEHGWGEPSPFLRGVSALPTRGKVLDLAGGSGRNALWLAKRGLQVTIADISPAGLRLARDRAMQLGLSLCTVETDLEVDGIPPGPWDAVVSIHYLDRALFEVFPQVLVPGGLLVFLHPTVINLERHAKPPRRFLLEPGELATLVRGFGSVELEESWSDGFHEARLVARK